MARDGGRAVAMRGPWIAVCVLLVTLAIFEIGARVWPDKFADQAAFARYASREELLERFPQRLTPHRHLGYVPAPGYGYGANRHDELGFRGEGLPRQKSPSEFRIAALGGSTTYTPKVEDWRLSYPELLGAELRQRYAGVRVINAGAAGWSSFESLLNLELRVLDLEPDLVIVYHGINDIHSRLVWPPDAYRGDNSGRRAFVATDVDRAIERSVLARILGVRAGWLKPQTDYTRTLDRAPSTYHGDLFYATRPMLSAIP